MDIPSSNSEGSCFRLQFPKELNFRSVFVFIGEDDDRDW